MLRQRFLDERGGDEVLLGDASCSDRGRKEFERRERVGWSGGSNARRLGFRNGRLCRDDDLAPWSLYRDRESQRLFHVSLEGAVDVGVVYRMGPFGD